MKLWLVGEISSCSFWLQACNRWSNNMNTNCNSNRAIKFEDHVATGVITQPFDNTLKKLFAVAVKNAKELKKQVKLINKKGHFIYFADRIKIRHKIFDVCRLDFVHA